MGSLTASFADTPGVSTTSMQLSTPSMVSVTVTASTEAIRSIHLTSWQAGSTKYRHYLDKILKDTVVNAVTIDIKEYQGEVYIPGVRSAKEAGAYVPAMPDIETWLVDLKKRGVYTIARIVVFKDDIMPRKRPALGVHNPLGELWYDKHHTTWLDPYNKDAWRYNLLIALQASKLGFDEVQFDYIRFPTDGNLSQTRFRKPYSRNSASAALVEFINQARQLLHPLGTKISIDVFGLTTSVSTGMGIGQLLGPMTAASDYVCPMVYPSHYAKGEYGIPNPNKEPYRTVHHSLTDAVRFLGPQESLKLRPYLQDFSLGVHYGAREVRAQIKAASDAGIQSWALWNPRCIYTVSALEKTPPPTPNSDHVAVSTP